MGRGATRHERLLRAADREFLDASIRAEQAEQARERRRVRRLRQILAGLATRPVRGGAGGRGGVPATLECTAQQPGRDRTFSFAPKQAMNCTAFGPRERIVACGDQLYDVTDPRRPKVLSTLRDPDRPILAVPGSAYFSPDGNILVVAQLENSSLFDVSSPSRPRFRAKISTHVPVPTIAFSPDGSSLHPTAVTK
ncbi:hypothetical protein [Candidatus Protofrankia californiensis]|uniref:hypothetical protein n=1 Tax=Candidatus Protofrankia californiensis TaxID=1839754 RepID=UPI0010411FBC|nr:hypothetical protein [Candidatus Protofrankia californiensis]